MRDRDGGAEGGGWRDGRAGAWLARLAQPPAAMGSASRIAHSLLLATLFLYSWPFILATCVPPVRGMASSAA